MVHPLTVGYFVVLVSLATAGQVSLKPPVTRADGSEELVVSLSSPNLTLLHDDVYVCVSYRLSEAMDLVKISPHPKAGNQFHMFGNLCEEPGYRGVDTGEESHVWECGVDAFAQPNPPLTRGTFCYAADGGSSYGVLNYQFQKGSPEEGTLVLPPGTGVKVGGKNAPKYMVAGFHFPKKSGSIDGTTGGSRLEFTLVKSPSPMKPVTSMTLIAHGFVGAQSVGTVTGSWAFTEEMPAIRIWNLYSHWHDLVTDVQIYVKRPDGGEDLLLHQDPHVFAGVTSVNDNPSAVVGPGDRLTVKCTYNNTMDKNLRIWDRDVCVVMVFYSIMDGETKKLQTRTVESFDPQFKDCFKNFGLHPLSGREEQNWNAVSSFTGNVTLEDCTVADLSITGSGGM